MFTPSGEQAWAADWEPQFPCIRSPETEPGTVFVTDHAGRRSIWTVVRYETSHAIQYATVIPDERAGLVTVTCQASAEGTEAMVSYELTALSPGANGQLEHFAARFESLLSHWEVAIASSMDG